MLANSSTVNFHVYDTTDQARQAAATAAAETTGYSFPCTIFKQGHRTSLASAMPYKLVREKLRRRSAERSGSVQTALNAINRPLDLEHARAVMRYIRDNLDSTYVLPPLTLNIQQPIDVYTLNSTSHVRTGYFVLHSTATLSITDGQHRQVAIALLAEQLDDQNLAKLDEDSVAVMITCESDVKQIHQDFADCSKTKALPKSQLAVYDRRNPANGLVIDLIDICPLFRGKIDATSSTLSKKSLSIFLSNQVRQLVKELLIGSYAESDESFEGKALEILERHGSKKYNEYLDRFAEYINTVADNIPVLKQISELDAGVELNKIPAYREQGWVCLTATGLNVIGRIGHELFRDKYPNWQDYAQAIGKKIDWNRTAEIWKDNIVREGKIITSQGPLKQAVATVRKAIGLPKVNGG